MAEMNYGVKAIETRYAGTVFRSRLEARWAAFFDVLGWPWTYEPFDLDGWSPDFMLQPVYTGRENSGGFEQSNPVLVEVKPIDGFCAETANRMSNALDKSGNELEPLLVGLSPFYQRHGLHFTNSLYHEDQPVVGWLGEYMDYVQRRYFAEGQCHNYDAAVLRSGDTIPDNTEIKADFCHQTGNWRHRITGYYDGTEGGLRRDVCQRYWGEACNKVKYRAEETTDA